ncbi:MAG: DUF3419 family protein [Caldilineaceae bacterium]|nr:DUF3419 family protein [Caldilineaceae bacterium]
MSRLTPPFQSLIFYSVQNEDYRTELAVLAQIGSATPLRVLLVASSGENALNLLTQERVGQLYAVDINPAQLHLCELRRTATHHLSSDEQMRLLGADPATVGEVGREDRLLLYDRLAPHLPDAARSFWDERREQEIAWGVQQAGRNDALMHDIQEHLQTAGFAPLRRPLADEELPHWQAVYTELMTPAYIRSVFGMPSEALAARIAGIAGYLAEQHFRALQQTDAQHNYFLTTAFANRYADDAGEDGLPLYLQEQGWATLRRIGTQERLHLRTGSIFDQMDQLVEASGPFDLISISNIADWMSDEQYSGAVARIAGALGLGGALLARTGTGSSMILEQTGKHLQLDAEFNRQLSHAERGPWFRTIVAGFRI